MAEKKFDNQINYGWGLTLDMTGKVPSVSKRIFPTYNDAMTYVNDANDSAIIGIQISVTDDSDETKNGVYYVNKIGTQNEDKIQQNDGEIIQFISQKNITEITNKIISEMVIDCGDY